MNFHARLPADFPVLPDRPVWLFLVLLLLALSALWALNDLYFAWLHRSFPGLFRPRALLAILIFCVGIIAIGLVINPPSEVRKAMKAHQAEFPK